MKKVTLLLSVGFLFIAMQAMQVSAFAGTTNMGKELLSGGEKIIVDGVLNAPHTWVKEVESKGFTGVITGIFKMIPEVALTTPGAFIDGLFTIIASPVAYWDFGGKVKGVGEKIGGGFYEASYSITGTKRFSQQ